MGFPVEIERGNTCWACTPDPWKEFQTPRYMRIAFHDIEPCPHLPPDLPTPTDYFLAKLTGNCYWSFGRDGYSGFWNPRGNKTIFYCTAEPAPPVYFAGEPPGGCDMRADNILDCGLGDDFHKGEAEAFESGGPTWEFSQTQNMCPQLPLKFEEWDIGNFKKMYRIADGTKKVNILFKYNEKKLYNPFVWNG